MSQALPLLLIETATRRAVVGLATADGRLLAERGWDSPHRHGEELLPRLDRLLRDSGREIAGIGAVAVGKGPGSFTGLRIALATAKVIAYTLAVPIVGISTTRLLAAAALAKGATGSVAVVLPAGVADRYVARYGRAVPGHLAEIMPPVLVAATAVPSTFASGDLVLAVDLPEDELGQAAAELGRLAQEGVAKAMAAAAAAALAAGEADEPASLVPSYVALPRGVGHDAQGMAWSPDLR